uniref:Uncharacterized protein n=1 Tax=Romanomermis culicivorax TaxID=13658 RepID=A0A915IW51_ROMCU
MMPKMKWLVPHPSGAPAVAEL